MDTITCAILLVICIGLTSQATAGTPRQTPVEIVRNPDLVQRAREQYRASFEDEIRARLDSFLHSEEDDLTSGTRGFPLWDTDLVRTLKEFRATVIPGMLEALASKAGDDKIVNPLHPNLTLGAKRRGIAALFLVELGDPAGTKAVLEILRSGSKADICGLCDPFSLAYALRATERFPASFVRSEDLRKAVLERLHESDPEIQLAAIGIAASLEISGLKEAVQEMWNNRRNAPSDYMLMQFARLAPSVELVQVIGDRLPTSKEPLFLIRDLGQVAMSGEPEARQAALDMLVQYAERHLDSHDLNEVISFVASAAAPAQLPLLKRLLTHPHHEVSSRCWEAVGRLEGVSVDDLKDLLKKPHLKYWATQQMGQQYRGTHNAQLVSALLSAADEETKNRTIRSQFCTTAALAMLDIGGPEAEKATRLLPFCSKWPIECRLKGWGIEHIAARLRELGLITSVKTTPVEAERDLGWQVFFLFSESGLGYSYDHETGLVVPRHDMLLCELGEHSGHLFTPEACLQPVRYLPQNDEDDEESDEHRPEYYDVQFVYRDTLYKFKVSPSGDYYDSTAVIDAANFALKDQHVEKQFIWLSVDDAPLVFVNPAAFKQAQEEGVLPRSHLPGAN